MTIFSANQLKFDKDYLNELTSDPNSGVFRQQGTYHVALHPAQFTDFGQSIKDELGKKIARYDESFQGLMLGYENIQVHSQLGVIGSDNCHVHLDLDALVFVFRPQIGMVLKGKVTRTTKDHVGCLVYNTFNVSLPKPEVDGTWLGDNVAIKSEVSFKISFVDLNARLPHIRGHLLSVETQGINGVSPTKSAKKGKKTKFVDAADVCDKEEKTQKDKKRKSISEVTEHKDSILEDELVVEKQDDDEILPIKLKKSKKNKFKDYSSETELNMPTPKAEKKKRKKSTSFSFSIGENSLHSELILKDEIKQEEAILTPTKYKENENIDELKIKKKKKKDKNREKEDLDVPLESFDIKSLFKENSSYDEKSFQLDAAGLSDKEEKPQKNKKIKSISKVAEHTESILEDKLVVRKHDDDEISSIKFKNPKKNKFKDYNSETELNVPTPKTEKKKRKKSISFSLGENSLHSELILKDEIKEEEVILTPTKYKENESLDELKTKKKKKKDKNKEKEDLDVSLESLDIKSLFKENSSYDEKSFQLEADSPDKKKKRRQSQLASQEQKMNFDNFKLEADSDLETIIGRKGKVKS